MRSVLAALVLLVAVPTADAAVKPVTGKWEGTGQIGERKAVIRASVVHGTAGLALSQLRTTTIERCTHPETGQTKSTTLDVEVRRLAIRQDGTFSGGPANARVEGRFTTSRRATGTITTAPEGEGCTGATITFVITPLTDPAEMPPGDQARAPVLTRFVSGGRIASGRVAGYDLREESTDFDYRIRGAERLEARVQRRSSSGRWNTLGTVTARPPRSPDFWPIFKNMGNGTYRIVARAQNGTGKNKRFSKPRIVRFTVVSHIPHSD